MLRRRERRLRLLIERSLTALKCEKHARGRNIVKYRPGFRGGIRIMLSMVSGLSHANDSCESS
jgi:hypothetical protein